MFAPSVSDKGAVDRTHKGHSNSIVRKESAPLPTRWNICRHFTIEAQEVNQPGIKAQYCQSLEKWKLKSQHESQRTFEIIDCAVYMLAVGWNFCSWLAVGRHRVTDLARTVALSNVFKHTYILCMVNIFSGIYPEDMETCVHKTYMWMFSAVLFTTVPDQK